MAAQGTSARRGADRRLCHCQQPRRWTMRHPPERPILELWPACLAWSACPLAIGHAYP